MNLQWVDNWAGVSISSVIASDGLYMGKTDECPWLRPQVAGTEKHRTQVENHQTLTRIMTKAEFNTIAGASPIV